MGVCDSAWHVGLFALGLDNKLICISIVLETRISPKFAATRLPDPSLFLPETRWEPITEIAGKVAERIGSSAMLHRRF